MTLTLAASQPMSAPVAKDVSMADFGEEVLRASMEKPVLVDFWAEWCGPCKQLAPALEKAVEKANGKVKLVKVDIDKNKQLAAQMGIQSIPAVFAFYKGQPLDGFMGVQPESSISRFIDALIKMSGGQTSAEVIKKALDEAEALLAQGQAAEAHELFLGISDADPSNLQAQAGLIRVALALGQTEEAREMLADLLPEIQADKAFDSVRAALALAEQAQNTDHTALKTLEQQITENPANHQARFDLAMALHAAGNTEAAIDHLVELVKRDRKWNNEAARAQLLTLFEALGPMHELTVSGRRKLSAVLFS